MRIQHNIPAMSAYRNYTNNVSAMAKNLEKLSSGYKINRAGDDAAGLAISEKMRAQITGLQVAQKNAKDGISLVQTAEGALTEVHDMLNRMYSLAEQAANGTFDNEVDRVQLQKEVNSLRSEIDRISKAANFNGIKLLDGSLGESTDLSVDGVNMTDAAYAQGISIDTEKPGGSTGEYSFTIGEMFGSGDAFEISLGTGDPVDNAISSTLDASGGGGGATGKITLTYDITEQAANSFGGITKEDQAASIAKTLSNNTELTKHFEVSVNGSTVTLKNINEGNKELTVTSVTAKDAAGGMKQATLGTATNVAGVAGTAVKFKLANALDGTKGFEFDDGGKVVISIEDANGNIWKASVDIKRGDNDAATHNNLKTALLETDADKAVYFENIDGTVADESRIKFSDLFDVAISGSGNVDLEINGKANAGTEIFKGKDLKFQVFDRDGTELTSANSNAAGKATDATGALGSTAAIFKSLKLDTTGGDADYSVGDQIELTGKLSDGRDFKVKLTAGEDFEIGDTHGDTNDNIIYALANARGSGVDVTVGEWDASAVNSDGTTGAFKDGAETVNSKDIFGESGATGKEITVAKATGASDLEFTSSVKSNGLNGRITAAAITTKAEIGTIGSTNFKNGIQQTGATTNISIEDGKVAEGSVVTVDGQSYVLTENDAPADADSSKTYVKVASLANAADVASALSDAINTKVNGDTPAGGTPKFQAVANGGTVTLTTSDVGSTATAIEAGAKGAGSQSALTFTLDSKQVSSGSRVTIEGREYEFVANADRATKNDDGTDKYNVVVVSNLNVKSGDGAVTSKQLGDALKSAVEKNIASDENPDGDKISIDVDDTGLVTLKGTDFSEDNTGRFVYNTPKDARFYRRGGLTLQIGDTSESFNQMTVVVNAVNTKAMKIDGIDISTQEGASDAMAAIKEAINYVSDVRGTLGATQNRLDHTINNLSVMRENIQDAESTIRDVDVAEEMMAYTKNSILVQSAQAMLAQANQLPQGVLQLLG